MIKKILDPCCGSRMFHFDKHNPLVEYGDIRKEECILSDGRKLVVAPDTIMDVTNMSNVENEKYYLIIWDPPHLKRLGEKSWMYKKYGKLPDDWQSFINNGFMECWRVLKPNGTLILKWNVRDVTVAELLKNIPLQPIVGHKTGNTGATRWLTFFKDK